MRAGGLAAQGRAAHAVESVVIQGQAVAHNAVEAPSQPHALQSLDRRLAIILIRMRRCLLNQPSGAWTVFWIRLESFVALRRAVSAADWDVI